MRNAVNEEQKCTCEACDLPWIVALDQLGRRRRFCLLHTPVSVATLMNLESKALDGLRKRLNVVIDTKEFVIQAMVAAARAGR